MPLKILFDAYVVLVFLLVSCLVYQYIRMRKNELNYAKLQAITLNELAPDTCFTVLDTIDDAYIIDIMKRSDNELEPTEDLRRLKGEKGLLLTNIVAYEVCESWTKNQRNKFLRKLYLEQLSVA